MIRVTRISNFTRDGSERMVHAWQAVNRQPNSIPGWLTRVVIFAFFIVIGIPFLLLVALALLVATVVFGVLWGANQILARVRGVLPRNDGRENVRVITRDEK